MMMNRQSGLGRGLGAIIPPKSPSISSPASVVSRPSSVSSEVLEGDPVPSDIFIRQLPIEAIDPNPHQPREHFDHAGLEELVSSIQIHGVMQPIVVTTVSSGRYELIAGERRLRASKIAELKTIPAIIRTATDQEKLELAIIENIQRRDLNPLEEAKAYVRLQNEFNLTQDEIGRRVGKSRPQVANLIRLLQLPAQIQTALQQGAISMSNARTLLSLATDEERLRLFQAMLEGNFTVRQVEARVPRVRMRRSSVMDPNIEDLEKRLRNALGMKVTIKRDPRGEGEIRIGFLNEEDLQSIAGKILGSES